MKKIIVQGFPGCFHEEAARKYFSGENIVAISASNFNEMADLVNEDKGIDFGIMAIENSIAGSLLQNYRILREHQLCITGEVYLRIEHQLMALPGQSIEEIYEVSSHPMAINQCLQFFRNYKHIRLVESEDTALSAKRIREKKLTAHGAIASKTAADIYELEILFGGIETSKVNYTRFFIISNTKGDTSPTHNKASIYCRILHDKGSLLKVLQCIDDNNVNISKLQSYPVMGKLSQYFFHIDLVFKKYIQFETLIEEMKSITMDLNILGVYEKANIYDYQTIEKTR